jgi:hypothetical protein
MKRAALFLTLAVALALAGCAGGVPFQAGEPIVFRAEFKNDAGSWCDKSEPVYDAHRYSCAVTPVHVACAPANMTAAKQARENTKKECAGTPAESTDVAKVKGLVETQQAIARKR